MTRENQRPGHPNSRHRRKACRETASCTTPGAASAPATCLQASGDPPENRDPDWGRALPRFQEAGVEITIRVSAGQHLLQEPLPGGGGPSIPPVGPPLGKYPTSFSEQPDPPCCKSSSLLLSLSQADCQMLRTYKSKGTTTGSGLWPEFKQTEPEPALPPSALEPTLPAQLSSAECAVGVLENWGCLGGNPALLSCTL